MATRERAGLFDQSSFAKIEVQGQGALGFLQRLCANDIDRPVGTLVYTQMLNQAGGIESDFTVTRLGESRFRIVTGTAFGNHDLGWLRKHLPDDGSVVLNDVSSAYACFCLWGPRARDILQPLTKADLSHEGFRYMTARELSIGDVPAVAARVTYVGELGWELYCPAEYGAGLWDLLWQAGADHGLTACGYRAIDALRHREGLPRVGIGHHARRTGQTRPGWGLPSRLTSPAASSAETQWWPPGERGLERRMACLVLSDPRAVTLGSEPVRVGGEVVGRVTTGGFGYAVGRSIALAYLPVAHAEVGTAVDIEVFGEWVAAEVAAEPLYDPKGERIRA